MKPVATLPAARANALRALAFDLDDTFLDEGQRLSERAYATLFRLREAGLALIAVTGRPSGWGEVIARQWPIDGAVTENGAVCVSRTEGGMSVLDFAGDERPSRSLRLAEVVAELRARHPELEPSDDVRARRSDHTFDIGERRRVARDVVAAARRTARELGARTIASSVHLHVTLDALDKASGTARFLAARFGWDPTALRHRVAFIGDSENDEACFNACETTIAVANFRGRPTVAPRYVTQGARGEGFAEAAATLVALRGGADEPGRSPLSSVPPHGETL